MSEPEIDPHAVWQANGQPPLTFEDWTALPSEVKNQFSLSEIRQLAEDGDWSFVQHQDAERYSVDFEQEREEYGKNWNDPEFIGKTNGGANGESVIPARVIDAGTFLRSYEPLSYTFDGVLPSGYLYGLTGVRGHGKTAMAITMTIAIAKGGEAILCCRVAQGRVAYITKENPTDFKMKLAVNCFVRGLSFDDVAPLIAIIPGDDSPEAIMEGLRLNAEKSGQFVLVIYDTFQAGFDGDEFNNNAQVLKFIKRLRPLTTLPDILQS